MFEPLILAGQPFKKKNPLQKTEAMVACDNDQRSFFSCDAWSAKLFSQAGMEQTAVSILTVMVQNLQELQTKRGFGFDAARITTMFHFRPTTRRSCLCVLLA